MKSSPITFQPLYKTRVWGGRVLEDRYARTLPDEQPYGESWELVDRAEDQSVVTSTNFQGKILNELWSNHRSEVFGEGLPDSERFPISSKFSIAKTTFLSKFTPPQPSLPR